MEFCGFQRFWTDSVHATPPESTVVRKLRGLIILRRSTVAGERVWRAVTCFPANGCLIILRIRCTMSRSALTCRTSWRVTSMEGLIWGISIGDGNPIIAT